MKKVFILLIVSVTVFAGCKKTNDGVATETGYCDGVSSAFTADVLPLINTYCTTGGNCHANGSINSGGELTNYNQVSGMRVSIRRSVNLGSMPVNTILTEDQKKKIICWIDNGATNN